MGTSKLTNLMIPIEKKKKTSFLPDIAKLCSSLSEDILIISIRWTMPSGGLGLCVAIFCRASIVPKRSASMIWAFDLSSIRYILHRCMAKAKATRGKKKFTTMHKLTTRYCTVSRSFLMFTFLSLPVPLKTQRKDQS